MLSTSGRNQGNVHDSVRTQRNYRWPLLPGGEASSHIFAFPRVSGILKCRQCQHDAEVHFLGGGGGGCRVLLQRSILHLRVVRPSIAESWKLLKSSNLGNQQNVHTQSKITQIPNQVQVSSLYNSRVTATVVSVPVCPCLTIPLSNLIPAERIRNCIKRNCT